MKSAPDGSDSEGRLPHSRPQQPGAVRAGLQGRVLAAGRVQVLPRDQVPILANTIELSSSYLLQHSTTAPVL
jgi:hypothetical protein